MSDIQLRGLFVVGGAHVFSAVITTVALRFFLTPPAQIHTIPDQPVRYATYALAVFAIATAAGTVLGIFVTQSSWLPAIYLWLMPLAIVLYPAVDPAAAGFVYTGVTSHFAGVLALLATVLWLLGLSTGTLAVIRATGYRIPRR